MTTNNITYFKLSEINNNQPLYVVGLMGSPASGKSTLCYNLTKKKTQSHSKELINGCSIKMGFANLIICNDELNDCSDNRILKHISIADNPGHNIYMLNLLAGLNNIDYILFLVAADRGIDFQTEQHLNILKLMNINSTFFI
jgi:selenocysteine-specific elongation factor